VKIEIHELTEYQCKMKPLAIIVTGLGLFLVFTPFLPFTFVEKISARQDVTLTKGTSQKGNIFSL